MTLKVLVTGYPNSGTSFLCNLVVELGFSPGKIENLKPADSHNRYGYFENLKLRKFVWNYFDLGSFQPWNSENITKLIPDINEENKNEFHQNISDIIANEEMEVYKDNALPLYFQYFPEDAKYIVIERSPESIYESPKKGGHAPMPVSYDKFLDSYNQYQELCDYMKTHRNVLTIKYEDFNSNFAEQLNRISGFLKVPAKPGMEEIFKPRNNDSSINDKPLINHPQSIKTYLKQIVKRFLK